MDVKLMMMMMMMMIQHSAISHDFILFHFYLFVITIKKNVRHDFRTTTNLSDLVEELLNETRYNSRARPGADTGEVYIYAPQTYPILMMMMMRMMMMQMMMMMMMN